MSTLGKRLAAIREDSAFKSAVWFVRRYGKGNTSTDDLLWLAGFRFGFNRRSL